MNLGAAAVRGATLLRLASPGERLRLLDPITTQAATSCVHLDDTRDPERVRVGEALYTSTELLAAEPLRARGWLTSIDSTAPPAPV